MSDELNLHREHEEVAYEREDLNPRGIFAFLVGLGLVLVLAYFVVKGMEGYLDAYQKQHQPPLNPLVTQTENDSRKVSNADIARFPQPRLETNERLEINDFRLQEEKTLNSYSWVDQQAGVARIPIEAPCSCWRSGDCPLALKQERSRPLQRIRPDNPQPVPTPASYRS